MDCTPLQKQPPKLTFRRTYSCFSEIPLLALGYWERMPHMNTRPLWRSSVQHVGIKGKQTKHTRLTDASVSGSTSSKYTCPTLLRTVSYQITVHISLICNRVYCIKHAWQWLLLLLFWIPRHRHVKSRLTCTYLRPVCCVDIVRVVFNIVYSRRINNN